MSIKQLVETVLDIDQWTQGHFNQAFMELFVDY